MNTFDPGSWLAIGPQIALCTTALIVMVLYALKRSVSAQAAVSGVGIFVGIILTLVGLGAEEILTFPALPEAQGVQTALRVCFVALDGYAGFFFLICLFVAFTTCMIAGPYLKSYGSRIGEFYIAVLFATVGMMFMSAAQDMLVLYLGLETMSLSAYALSGLFVHRKKSEESALKYFLTGAFGSAIFLYGVAFLYGATGTISFDGLRTAVANPAHTAWATMGAGLLISGFAFKVGAVPFHMWAPDVYQGAPTPISGLMAVGVKAAAFAALTRIVLIAFDYVDGPWITMVLYALSVVTMAWGNIAAVAQRNIKRLLAYSSIAHAGYVLIAVTVHNEVSRPAILLYMAAYAFMTLGAFAVVILLERRGERFLEINDYSGLARRHPYVAVCMTIFLLSLAGVPPTLGFIGKWYIFSAAITHGFIALAIIGVATSLVAIYYYMRVVYVMFMKEPPEKEEEIATVEPSCIAARVVAFGFAAMILVLGLFPSGLIAAVRNAVMM